MAVIWRTYFMSDIQYIKGDATNPIGDGKKIIIHCCNDIGAWGAGFVIALSRKWPVTKSEYLKWHKSKNSFKLGSVQFVKVEDNIIVGNMIGQHGIGNRNKTPPIRYSAIEKCLEKVQIAASRNNASVHAPKFGAGLAGGEWKTIEALIIKCLSSQNISVTIYNYQP